jgi:enoyl-CoA hydratase
MGATQRLTRAVGKSRAMEMILTGARVSAQEASKIGLISRTVPTKELIPEARKLAGKIAAFSAPVTAKAKECINAAFEGNLAEGIKCERREFWSCFALEDQKEGMAAFLQKRQAVFKDA